MTRTPVDGADSRSVEETDRGSRAASVFERVAMAVRSVGRTIRGGIRSLFDPSSDRTERSESDSFDRTTPTDRNRSVQCVGLTDDGVESDGTAVSDQLARTGTTAASDRDGPDDDRPDLVVRRGEGELTLAAPDDPEASITSTYWESVER